MEAFKGLIVYIIITGKDMSKTMIVANDKKEAIRKFFNMFTNLRDAVLNNEISNILQISWDKEKEEESSIPYLVILGAISRKEAISFLNKYVKNIKKSETNLNKGMQKCQWIREIR